MPLTKQEWLDLEAKANQLRHTTLDTTLCAGSGHIGGSLSAMDMLVCLYYKYMNIKVEDPDWIDRDRFILSKGHIGIGYAGLLIDKGWNEPDQLKTFNLSGSKMGVHLDSNKVVGVDASTGSLGHGLSIAVGTALAARVRGKDYITYCMLGDGELDEGSNWEAAMSASQFKLDNLICFVDRNMFMMDGSTEEEMALEPLDKKFEAFGFNTLKIDGNNIKEICDAIDNGLACKGKPTMIIAQTIKGCGIEFMENQYKWHYGAIDQDMHDKAAASLDETYKKRVARVEKEA